MVRIPDFPRRADRLARTVTTLLSGRAGVEQPAAPGHDGRPDPMLDNELPEGAGDDAGTALDLTGDDAATATADDALVAEAEADEVVAVAAGGGEELPVAAAAEPADADSEAPADEAPADKPAPRRRRAARRVTAPPAEAAEAAPADAEVALADGVAAETPTADPPTADRPAADSAPAAGAPTTEVAAEASEDAPPVKRTRRRAAPPAVTFQPPAVTFQPPVTDDVPLDADAEDAPPARRRRRRAGADAVEPVAAADEPTELDLDDVVAAAVDAEDDDDEDRPASRRRRRGRRGRGRSRLDGEGEAGDEDSEDATAETEGAPTGDDAGAEGGEAGTRRRRRRRRNADGELVAAPDDPPNTVVRVREPRNRPRTRDDSDDVRGVTGSTRLEAKRQRRREGRDQGRRRAPILTEAEFLARREEVDRVMVVRQTADVTQVGVLEDGILAEHYITKATATSYAGNVYLGRVQNVLPSMEAAFVDIGKGRNAVLYAGEVNYDASGIEGKATRIEQALKAGQTVIVQVTKDPIGHKGARLTSQISLPGRYLVYVPEGSMTGISRKLPENERKRLKDILKQIVPDNAGVIIRTAAEGASEEELTRDVTRLQAQWEEIQKKAAKAGSSAPTLLYSEPDLVIRVIRDIFNEDFSKVVVQGDSEWDVVESYVGHVAPDLQERLERFTGEGDVFDAYRIDEQLTKALDRKVWLPSGGSLVIDRTEAMTVVDVNTGKYVGKGAGNLEETVTRNNLEAAEELVRQLRLRDIGGMIVVDFIDMVLESNRDLVLRRLTECLGRDRTKHQVAEVTSLGLVQMTRKRVGQGLLEAFSETCEHCNGRGVLVSTTPKSEDRPKKENGRRAPSPKAVAAAIAPHPPAADPAAADDAGREPEPPGSNGQPVDPADVVSLGEPIAESGFTEPATAATEPSAASAEVEVIPDVEVAADPAPAGRGRRRSRAASRPAGPPVVAG